jgi:hypothetical protein
MDSHERQRPQRSFPIKETRWEALVRLRAAAAGAIAAGRPVPCVADPEGGWTADDGDARTRAAWRCLDCAAFLACEQYVTQHPETGGVWAGRGYSPTVPTIRYLDRPEPSPEKPTTYVHPPRDVGMDLQAKPPLTRGFNRTKESVIHMTTTEPGTCLCGCGETAARNYKPGHDARHVGQLARAVTDGSVEKRAALKALPTDPLRAKFTRAVEKAAAK